MRNKVNSIIAASIIIACVSCSIRPIREIFRSGDKCYVEGVADGETLITSGQVFLFEALNVK